MLSALPPLKKSVQPARWSPGTVSPEARQLLRKIFSDRQDEVGLSTQEIYRDGFALMADRTRTRGGFEPSSEVHPFRSMRCVLSWFQLRMSEASDLGRHFKQCVLEDLAEAKEIEKVLVRVKERIPRPPPDDDTAPAAASPHTRPNLMEIVASVNAGEKQTVKVVLPPRGQVSDKFWVWRALPALFAPTRTEESRPKPAQPLHQGFGIRSPSPLPGKGGDEEH